MFYILKPQDATIRCLFYILLFKVAQYFWMHPYIFVYHYFLFQHFLKTVQSFHIRFFEGVLVLLCRLIKKWSPSVRSHFGLFLGSFQSILLYFLERVQSFFIKLCYIFRYIFYSNGYCTKLFTVMFPSAEGHFCFFFVILFYFLRTVCFLMNFSPYLLDNTLMVLRGKKNISYGSVVFCWGLFWVFLGYILSNFLYFLRKILCFSWNSA